VAVLAVLSRISLPLFQADCQREGSVREMT
jgi:hypothetical protein